MVTALILSTLLFLSGCFTGTNRNIELNQKSPNIQEGCAIYLLSIDSQSPLATLQGRLGLAEKPFISMEEILSYNPETFEFMLTGNAIKKLMDLQIPVKGKPFALCLNRQPVYYGFFWTPVSSISCDGIVILQPSQVNQNTVKVERGYPSEVFFRGKTSETTP